jgi:antibiotic biosynthesis monooxygenase (ABM) superfamily enzyme
MITDTLLDEPVTIMFTDHVKPDKIAQYEAWSAGTHGDAKRFPGYVSVDVIRPNENSHPEYTTLVKFDNCENLKHWRDSASLTTWLEQLPVLLSGNTYAQTSVGLQLWFDRPNIPQMLTEPPLWKQVAIGVMCVYPLILLLNWILEPIVSVFPEKLALLLNVISLSALLTYPVMPWVTRLLRPWLYPKHK